MRLELRRGGKGGQAISGVEAGWCGLSFSDGLHLGGIYKDASFCIIASLAGFTLVIMIILVVVATDLNNIPLLRG